MKALRRTGQFVLLWIGFLGLTACAQSTTQLAKTQFPDDAHISRVLLMPTDIELYELTAGGLLEPNAAWTAAGKDNVDRAIEEMIKASGEELVRFPADGIMSAEDRQLVKLHAAIGESILLHKYTPGFELPTKRDRFDWTMGSDAGILTEAFSVDYALFIHMRDSYTSLGRGAYMVAVAVLSLGRVVPHGGSQVGFASLVDLRTGDVVWFNRLARERGDLREMAPAREATEELLAEFPL